MPNTVLLRLVHRLEAQGRSKSWPTVAGSRPLALHLEPVQLLARPEHSAAATQPAVKVGLLLN